MSLLFNKSIELQEGQTFHLQLGTLRFHCTRLAAEWQISQTWEIEDITLPSYQTDYIVPTAKPNFRYMVGNTSNQFKIVPRLANMNMIVRPISPILVPKGAEVIFFVGTTVWLDIILIDGKSKCVHEVPTQQDSETWFGANTYEGALCYTSQTHARMHLNAIPKHAGRVITALKLKNKSDQTFQVDRLNVPIPYLSVYQDEAGFLYSNDVLAELEGVYEGIDINIQRTPGNQFGKVKRISDPRESYLKGALKKAVNAFLQ
jgi:hypothetical protein